MKNALYLASVLAFALVAGLALAATQPPDEVVIDEAADKRAPVTFPHATHVDAVDDCTTCHHTSEGLTATSGQEVATCVSCHLDPEEAGTPSMREMSLKKNPLHAGCIDCHKEQAKGPTKCDECHPKG
ncbi:MAG: cytochrome c3 family protein [Thermoanaerobaculia bacterium]